MCTLFDSMTKALCRKKSCKVYWVQATMEGYGWTRERNHRRGHTIESTQFTRICIATCYTYLIEYISLAIEFELSPHYFIIYVWAYVGMCHWKEHGLVLVGFACLGACVQLDSLELRSKSSTTGSLSGSSSRLRRVGFARHGSGVGVVDVLRCNA